MAPRTLGEILSFLTSDIVNFEYNYLKHIEEIVSHPKDLIIQNFSSVPESSVRSLRESLFVEILDLFEIERFTDVNILLDCENPIAKNLRKRYKTNTCLEDIYIFSISICEKQLHKDIEKAIISSKNVSPLPSLSSVDKTFVSSIREILENSKVIRKENKQIKEEIRLLREKVCGQNELINELRKTNEKILSIHNTLHSHNSDHHTHQVNVSSKTYAAKNNNGNTEVVDERSPSKSYAMVSASESFTKGAAVNHVAKATEVQNNVPHSDFIIVGKNNKPVLHSKSRPSGPVFGKKVASRNTIAGKRIVREFDVFIGGVSNDIDEEGLQNYMKEEINVEPINVVLNRENKFNRSYKVTVKSVDKQQVFNPEVWDNNIIVKPFRQKRSYYPQFPINGFRPQNQMFKSSWNNEDNFNHENHTFYSRWDEEL